MEEKTNIAELLKDCPIGMELDCTMFENVTFDEVITVICFDDKERVKIILSTHYSDGTKDEINLTEFGTYTDNETAKCVIFPKGKTTWEGFVPPCRFKDGDVVAFDTEKGVQLFIFKEYLFDRDSVQCYMMLDCDGKIYFYGDDYYAERLATEKEKQKLFNAIKANGYKWNAETKTLENLVEPIFKVGNKIEKCGYRFTIAEVKDDYYLTKCGNKIPIDNQYDFSLVPNKFDITTLNAFDKVLIRDADAETWIGAFYSHYRSKKFYIINGSYYYQCIPYEGNENLLGITDDCDEYYKTW